MGWVAAPWSVQVCPGCLGNVGCRPRGTGWSGVAVWGKPATQERVGHFPELFDGHSERLGDHTDRCCGCGRCCGRCCGGVAGLFSRLVDVLVYCGVGPLAQCGILNGLLDPGGDEFAAGCWGSGRHTVPANEGFTQGGGVDSEVGGDPRDRFAFRVPPGGNGDSFRGKRIWTGHEKSVPCQHVHVQQSRYA